MFPSSNKSRIFHIAKITKQSCMTSPIMSPFVSSGDVNIEGMIDLYVRTAQNKTVSAFHSNFCKFKQALCFKRVHRKTKIDSILKKCKSKFFRTVQEALRFLLEDYVAVPHLPQSFITNINIDINKKHLKHSLKDILTAFNVSFDFDRLIRAVPYFKQETVRRFMLMSYKDLFQKYIEANRFKEDCDVIRDREGKKFELLFRYVAKIYVEYYSMSKGNKSKPLTKAKEHSACSYQINSEVAMTESESQKNF